MLTATRRRLAAACEGDDGMTLIELLVAMAVAVVLAAMAGYFFIGTSNASTQATEQSLGASQARDALQQWTQLIRVANNNQITSIINTTPTPSTGVSTLTFSANVGNRTGVTVASGLSTVTLTIDRTRNLLTQTIVDPSGNTTTKLLLGCTLSSANYCLSKGDITAGQFTAYYTGTGCATASLTPAGLCIYDPANSPSVTDAVAVGIAFTIDGVTGLQHANAQAYSTLAAVGSAT